ncbi:hypothetical protein ACOBR2_17090 [Telmatobacter bradus]|uniref:hypothetical protein n=1 Tax=Telmatobacter bradus TaxID=474953 RepID=UPI003B4374E0
MAVLSIDLACRRWADLGVVLLDRVRRQTLSMPWASQPTAPIECQILPMGPEGEPEGPVDPEILAGRLNHLCTIRDIRILMLDGPQAWKSEKNGLTYARLGERQLNTVSKTGLPGMVKPVTHRNYSEFCIDLYDALCRRGWRRLDKRDRGADPRQRVLVECNPHAAWKSLGLTPLPTKRRSHISDLAAAYAALRCVVPFTTNCPPNHDQLQALVSGLAGLALEEHNNSALRIFGAPPCREDGHWREGFIVLPVPPPRPTGFRWLN